MATPPLAGHLVLDLASVGPAARASRWLADYGATVVKVGPTPRHGGAQITPPFHAYGGHRAMKRARFDLKAAAGREAFLRLAAAADVVIESFRPGAAGALGIGYDDVRAVNPRVVYCSTSGYGQEGPYSAWAGHDLNYLALGGYLDCSGRDGSGAPALPGATIADGAAGGLHAVAAILAALLRRSASGEGAYLDVAVVDGVLALMSLFVDEFLATGRVPGPRHDLLTGRYACYDVYRCGDGRFLSVAAIEPRFWANLCAALGCERWVDHQTDDDAQEAIRADLGAAFASRPRDEWVAVLAPADTCVAPVYSVPELVADPHLRARRAFVDARRPGGEPFAQVGFVLAGMDRAQPDPEARDMSVSDTRELLLGVGLTVDEVDALEVEGAVA
jgi:alpha-methylacyl-CoA racemase